MILILTRWHVDDLAGYLLSQPDKDRWRVINIPAQANHNPDDGETDPLGREPGEWMQSARKNELTGHIGRTDEEWEQIRIQAGPRDFSALYQGSPNPETGNVFPKEWARYTEPLWIDQGNGVMHVPGIGRDDHELIQSWDFTFKDKPTSDFVVGQVWLRVGVDAYLLDMVRRRMNFNASEEAIVALSAKWPQAVTKFIEDKANGPAVINSLQKRLFGLIPIEPEGSKYARASAISPLAHSRNIILPTAELLPNVEELVEEAKAFPNGAHDDTIDAMSQGINRMLLMPLLNQGNIIEPDVYDEYNAQGWSISPV